MAFAAETAAKGSQYTNSYYDGAVRKTRTQMTASKADNTLYSGDVKWNISNSGFSSRGNSNNKLRRPTIIKNYSHNSIMNNNPSFSLSPQYKRHTHRQLLQRVRRGGGDGLTGGSFSCSNKSTVTTSMSTCSKMMNRNEEPNNKEDHSCDSSISQDVARKQQKGVPYSYYLLWSKGMFRKFKISTLLLIIFHFTILRKKSTILDALHNQQMISSSFSSATAASSANTASILVNKLIHNIVLPLSASACCLVQLILNALATGGGCAGFNSYLGQLRPYFVSILAYVTIRSSFTTLDRGNLSGLQLLAASAPWIYRWFVALLPEVVHLWNTQHQRFRRATTTVKKIGKQQVTVYLNIPTMGCVACINKIDSSLAKCDKVDKATSWLEPVTGADGVPTKKGGKAAITLALSTEDKEQLDEVIIPALVETVRDAGFSCTVDEKQFD